MNALLRAACGGASSPREWRRSLRAQRGLLRAALTRPSIASIGVRFRGAILGEELIETLSERLARSLQGWNAPALERLIAAARERSVPMETGDSPATRQSAAGPDRVGATARERADMATGTGNAGPRVWSGSPDHVAASESHIDDSRDDDARARVGWSDTAIAEGGAEILRAVGLDVPSASSKRDVQRASPLEVALERYQALGRSAAETTTKSAMRYAMDPSEGRSMPVGAAPPNEERVRSAPVVADADIAPRRAPHASETPVESGERVWWSARVDAIHTRPESFAPAPVRPGAGRFEDELPDESAFADTLAEVLHRQARAYGVVVP